MASFKHKPSKLKYLSNTKTLDEMHKDQLSKFNSMNRELPQKKKLLQSLSVELREIEHNNKVNSDIDIKHRANLKCQIKELEKDIFTIENNTDMLDYIGKTCDVLVSYYELTTGIHYNTRDTIKDEPENNNIIDDVEDNNDNSNEDNNNNNYDDNCDKCNDNISNRDDTTNTESGTTNTDKKNMGIFLSDKLKALNQISQKSRKIKKPVKKRRITREQSCKSILKFLPTGVEEQKDTEPLITRAALQAQYLSIIDKTYACDKAKVSKIMMCSECNIEKIFQQNDGSYACIKCGEAEFLAMENEVSNHKELSSEKQKYPYKKINHLKEKLNQFQSKESADVPDEICNIVRAELKKRRKSAETCTPSDIKEILKQHRLTYYYEHLQQLHCKISKAPPITLSRNIEEKIITMFQQMQNSFRKHCPKQRSNFLSYAYVLNKLFKILQMPDHAKYFNLLKSKDKLREQDVIWLRICKDMNWPFYSSF